MLLVSIVSVRLTVEATLVLFEIYEVLCEIRDQGDGLGPTVISSDAKEVGDLRRQSASRGDAMDRMARSLTAHPDKG